MDVLLKTSANSSNVLTQICRQVMKPVATDEQCVGPEGVRFRIIEGDATDLDILRQHGHDVEPI